MTQVMEKSTPAPAAVNHYVRNMVALWRWDAKLAMAIDAVPPEMRVKTEAARDGKATARMAGANGAEIYLYSKYKPGQDAQQWAASVKIDDKYVVVINGFGLGYHVKALFERLSSEAMLIVSEPNLALLRTALEVDDYSAACWRAGGC